MKTEIRRVETEEERHLICERILNDLPNWFGLEEAKKEYVEESEKLVFWGCYEEGEAIGFLTLKQHMEKSAEIYVMGILRKYHHQHIGSDLMDVCKLWCVEQGIEYLQVKTLSEDSDDVYYEKTRKFYKACGFVALEVFPALWDPWNPCLLMVQKLEGQETKKE